MRRLAVFVAAAIFTTTAVSPCFANGFKVLGVKSSKATAMGEAFIVQADNPSAIAFNPAGITQLKGTQASVDCTVTNSWVDHISPAGQKEDILDRWQYIPAAYITSDLGLDDWAFGIGVTVPNGLSSDWSETGFARYNATHSKLTLIDINPCLAYKFNDNLSIGVGGSYYYSEVVLESRQDYGRLIGAPGAFDGKGTLDGTGYSWGWNAGIIYKLNERNRFAATFKSPYTIDYGGTAKYEFIPFFMGLGDTLETDVTASIKFPMVVVAGYAFWPVDKLKLEFNVEWTNWDTLGMIEADFESKSTTDVTYQYHYENTFAYKFGMEYSVTDDLQLRAGYIYNENAVPERYFRPSLPDTNTQFLCTGFGYEMGNFIIDGAMEIIFYEDRNINNNVDDNETLTSSSIDGKYESFGLGFSLGLTYKF